MLKTPLLHHVLLLQFGSLVLGTSKSYRKKSKISSGGIAGTVVGVIVVVIFVVWCVIRWKQNKKIAKQDLVPNQ